MFSFSTYNTTYKHSSWKQSWKNLSKTTLSLSLSLSLSLLCLSRESGRVEKLENSIRVRDGPGGRVFGSSISSGTRRHRRPEQKKRIYNRGGRRPLVPFLGNLGCVVNASRGNITMSIPPRYYVTPSRSIAFLAGVTRELNAKSRSKRRD